MGPALRFNGASTSYLALPAFNIANSGGWTILRVVSGGVTTLGVIGIPANYFLDPNTSTYRDIQNGDKFYTRFAINGQSLSIKAWLVGASEPTYYLPTTFTDPVSAGGIGDPGYPGIMINTNRAGDFCSADDFALTDLAGEVSIVPNYTTVYPSATQQVEVVLFGVATPWTGSTVFTVSGGTGASIVTQSTAGSSLGVIKLIAGTATGTLTISDGTTTCTITVAAGSVIAPNNSSLIRNIGPINLWLLKRRPPSPRGQGLGILSLVMFLAFASIRS